jgi:outer membrane protein assembly factor BamB
MRIGADRDRVLALLAVLAGVVGWVGCGSSGGGTSSAAGEAAKPPAARAAFTGPRYVRPAPERTGYFRTQRRALDPPLRQTWSTATGAPIETAATVAGGVAYVVARHGEARAVRLRGGKTLWESGAYHGHANPLPEAMAPVYSDGRIFIVFSDGNLTVLDAASGKLDWKYDANSYVSAPPAVVGRKIYLVANRTNVIVLDLGKGFLQEDSYLGAIKSSPSYHHGRVFLADETGSVLCIAVGSDELVWRTDTSRLPSLGKGGFSSSPAVAFGHVFAVRDDGLVLSLGEKSGKVAWSSAIGSPVDGSPAVAKVEGTPASVYVGSADGRLDAFDALTGEQRWQYDAGKPLAGPAAVVGHTVYFSPRGSRETLGVDARTHRRTFDLRHAAYTPVGTGGRRIYMVGDDELVGMEPARR